MPHEQQAREERRASFQVVSHFQCKIVVLAADACNTYCGMPKRRRPKDEMQPLEGTLRLIDQMKQVLRDQGRDDLVVKFDMISQVTSEKG